MIVVTLFFFCVRAFCGMDGSYMAILQITFTQLSQYMKLNKWNCVPSFFLCLSCVCSYLFYYPVTSFGWHIIRPSYKCERVNSRCKTFFQYFLQFKSIFFWNRVQHHSLVWWLWIHFFVFEVSSFCFFFFCIQFEWQQRS